MPAMKENKMVRIFGFLSFESKQNANLSALCARELYGELPPAHLSSLVYRNFVDEKNPLRNLPAAEALPAKFQQLGLANVWVRGNTGRHFLITES